MYSGTSTTALPVVGFPIRKSRGQRLVSTSPGLIAAAHVLLRLLAPRHPPCALSLLIVKNSYYCCYGVFKVRASSMPAQRENAGHAALEGTAAGLSKLNSERTSHVEVDVDLGEPDRTDDSRRARKSSNGPSSHRSKSSGIPRKEVIQPQLPLRLPCYDFTPIIDPTFDGSLPYGLGHRLRVLPTFVV